MERDKLYKALLKRYCKHIIHMRQQYNLNVSSLGIVLGAGINNGIGLPDWETLVKRIARSEELSNFNGKVNDKNDNIANVQFLFQSYKTYIEEKSEEEDKAYNKMEMKIHAGWKRIVHSALYSEASHDIAKMVPAEHYLWKLVEIIKKTPMTVNYNFDDTLQRIISEKRNEDEKKGNRGYTTLWGQNVHMYPRNSVIYHPNGFLPYKISEHPSESIVFLEDSFADQLIDSMHGRYNVLSEYFANKTCLLIGLSLSDPTLKHLLRRSANNNPGNYHYYVKHVDNGDELDKYKDMKDAYFDIYNLVTLLLTSQEIGGLLDLIKMEEDEFTNYFEEAGLEYSSYKYILVGSVAAGKSTALSHFRNIATQDEWIDSMPEDMAINPSEIAEDRIRQIDEWVAAQWGKKNAKMLRIKSGMHIMDRGPLDAFAFTPKNEWKKKADITKNGISPGESKRKLCSAEVILLLGDPDIMASRAILSHKSHDAEQLRLQQELLKYVYSSSSKGMRVIDTRNKGKAQVAKEIARVIYMEDYSENPLNEILENISNGSLPEPAELL